MESELYLNVLFGSISSVLLAVVAYFIKQLHVDFKKMEKDLTEVKTMALLIKTEFKNSYDLLNQKVNYLERRLDQIENQTLKKEPYEKR
jgi:hypothetical protein